LNVLCFYRGFRKNEQLIYLTFNYSVMDEYTKAFNLPLDNKLNYSKMRFNYNLLTLNKNASLSEFWPPDFSRDNIIETELDNCFGDVKSWLEKDRDFSVYFICNEGESCQGFEGKENQYIGRVSNSKYSFDVIVEATRDKFGETHIHKYSDNLDEAAANLMKDVNDDPYIVEKEAARIEKEVLDKFTK
jgi:hypothetical protein